MQAGIPCTWMRGGTSKAAFFLEDNLPREEEILHRFLLSAMGSPDPSKRQINGIGGGDSLASKVAIVSRSTRDDADVDYLLCQVHLDKPIVETKLNCGNILSGVAPFAIEKGLVAATHPETTVRVFNKNTGIIIHATIQTPSGFVTYEGDTKIDGVPGTGAPIRLNFIDSVGSKTGKLFPTGNRQDKVMGIALSCVDVAVPMVIIQAESLGMTGYEGADVLNKPDFLKKLEEIRREAAVLMGLGDVTASVMPKICLVSKPRAGGNITSRYFDPFSLHSSHAVSGALCLAAASLIEGTVASEVAITQADKSDLQEIVIEHPAGQIGTSIKLEYKDGEINVPEASFIRTARPLMRGEVLVPSSVLRTYKPMVADTFEKVLASGGELEGHLVKVR